MVFRIVRSDCLTVQPLPACSDKNSGANSARGVALKMRFGFILVHVRMSGCGPVHPALQADCICCGRCLHSCGCIMDQKPRTFPFAGGKTESTPQKHQNPYNTTIEVSRPGRSIFFPNSHHRVRAEQQTEVRTLCRMRASAAFPFLSSAFGAGSARPQNSLEEYGSGTRNGTKAFWFFRLLTAPRRTIFSERFLSSHWRLWLRRDPRYFVTLHGGAGHRLGYGA